MARTPLQNTIRNITVGISSFVLLGWMIDIFSPPALLFHGDCRPCECQRVPGGPKRDGAATAKGVPLHLIAQLRCVGWPGAKVCILSQVQLGIYLPADNSLYPPPHPVNTKRVQRRRQETIHCSRRRTLAATFAPCSGREASHAVDHDRARPPPPTRLFLRISARTRRVATGVAFADAWVTSHWGGGGHGGFSCSRLTLRRPQAHTHSQPRGPGIASGCLFQKPGIRFTL